MGKVDTQPFQGTEFKMLVIWNLILFQIIQRHHLSISQNFRRLLVL